VTITVDPKFPNTIQAAIVVDETNLPTYLPNRLIPISIDRNGRILIAGTVAATLGTAVTISDAMAFASGSLVGAVMVGYNGASFDRLRSAGDNADAVAAATLGELLTLSRNTGFNGATWDRLRSAGDNADAVAAATLGELLTLSRNTGFNGATWDRLRSAGDNADAVAAATLGELLTLSRNTGFNGATWDRLRSAGDNADAVAAATLGELLTLSRNTGFNGATWDRLRTLVSNADAQAAAVTGLQGVVARLTGFNGTTFDRLLSAGDNADAVAVATLGELLTLARNSLFNGTAWDRARGNTEATVLASAARTTTTNSADQTNYNARGVHVLLNVTVVPGVDTVTLSIQGKDPVSAVYYTLLTGLAVVGAGMNVYKVFPGITAVANGTASDVLPRTWRVAVTHSAATSFTYSVGAALVI